MLDGLRRSLHRSGPLVGWRLLRQLVRSLLGLQDELRLLRLQLTRIAETLERMGPPAEGVPPGGSEVEVTYVNEAEQVEWMEIELGLTQTLGRMPTDEETLSEFERRHPDRPEAS